MPRDQTCHPSPLRPRFFFVHGSDSEQQQPSRSSSASRSDSRPSGFASGQIVFGLRRDRCALSNAPGPPCTKSWSFHIWGRGPERTRRGAPKMHPIRPLLNQSHLPCLRLRSTPCTRKRALERTLTTPYEPAFGSASRFSSASRSGFASLWVSRSLWLCFSSLWVCFLFLICLSLWHSLCVFRSGSVSRSGPASRSGFGLSLWVCLSLWLSRSLRLCLSSVWVCFSL